MPTTPKSVGFINGQAPSPDQHQQQIFRLAEHKVFAAAATLKSRPAVLKSSSPSAGKRNRQGRAFAGSKPAVCPQVGKQGNFRRFADALQVKDSRGRRTFDRPSLSRAPYLIENLVGHYDRSSEPTQQLDTANGNEIQKD